ncbi:probable transcription factor At3g04930 [Typha angustifolia]|uniref:probable transcription factor At3g04930 n=1 Tax=Typha angustifolia TaxID=59011 RepID=UPI003C2D49EB
MPTAEEEERAVFEDDDDDTDGDDSEDEEDEEDDETTGDLPAAAPPPPAPKAEENSSDSIAPPTSSSSDPTLNPNATPDPNPSTAPNPSPDPPSDPPQNGAITVVPVPIASAAPSSAAAAAAAYDESRRLFQRLWTDEDELIILRGFLEFTTRRGTAFASHQYDTGPFYEDMKKQLQLEFSKNQLIEKLRRLKKKYRNCVNRIRTAGKDFAFRSPHEQAIFEIARNIWSPSIKRARESDDDDFNTPNSADAPDVTVGNDGDGRVSRSRRRIRRRAVEESVAAVAIETAAAAGGGGTAVPVTVTVENSIPATTRATSLPSAMNSGIVEETVKNCLSPLFKELINSAIGGPLGTGLLGGALTMSPLPLNLDSNSMNASVAPVNEKWKKQQILELEVYLKRIELLEDQIKSTLRELKSSGT